MIALIASVLLGLYVFLPDFLFSKLASPFAELKRYQRTKLEEITAGIVVAAIPFFTTWGLSHHEWFFGHWPFPIFENESDKILEYKRLYLAAYRDEYFVSHESQIWQALDHVRWHQLRFLFWNYSFLLFEILITIWLSTNYGRFKNNWLYRHLIASWLLKRVSEWEILFTNF